MNVIETSDCYLTTRIQSFLLSIRLVDDSARTRTEQRICDPRIDENDRIDVAGESGV